MEYIDCTSGQQAWVILDHGSGIGFLFLATEVVTTFSYRTYIMTTSLIIGAFYTDDTLQWNVYHRQSFCHYVEKMLSFQKFP